MANEPASEMPEQSLTAPANTDSNPTAEASNPIPELSIYIATDPDEVLLLTV